MLIEVTGLKSSITELNHFNTIGEKNWKNEFFNKDFPNSFLITARSESGVLSGTQGFIEYKINYFGDILTGYRSERTLLSTECRGRGVFKKQIILGQSEILRRGGCFCFGATNATKAFEAAGFKVFTNYRIYDFQSFSFAKMLYLFSKLIFSYSFKHFFRIIKKEFEISDLYNFVKFKAFISYFNINNYFRKNPKTIDSKLRAELIEFKTDDQKTTDEISKQFNHRKDGIYLWIDTNLFSRLSCNYPTLHYLKLNQEGKATCHLILEKLDKGIYKIVMCSDYEQYDQCSIFYTAAFKACGIYGLISIRNRYRLEVEQLTKKRLGFSRTTGFGKLVFIDNVNLELRDLEIEELWLLL
jgi:hypothetical protein